MIDGLLLIDKSAGPTSHDVVARVRRILHTKKVGHAGTLDPFATGLLVVLVGPGTKLAAHLTGEDKTYIARCVWGQKTDTGDNSGIVTETCALPVPDTASIEKTMVDFTGPILQTPPMYSAKKIDGRRLYKDARLGREVERKPVEVHIQSLSLLEINEKGFSFSVRCGKGTYIRTLTEDICQAMGGFGHLDALRRTHSGRFALSDAITLESLEEKAEKGKEFGVCHMDITAATDHFPSVILNESAVIKLTFGHVPAAEQILSHDPFSAGSPLRLLNEEKRLLALALPRVDSKSMVEDEMSEKLFKIEYNFSAVRSS